MNISPARTAAFDILYRIETERAYSSFLLPFYEESLTVADKGLCHNLTLGTLRRQIFLDRLIDGFTGGKKIDLQIRIALRLGLYQLRYLDKIPDYSAINESVNLVQRSKKTSAKGFVNAILRRSLREDSVFSFSDKIDQLSVETSHPIWLIEKWVADLGYDRAASIASANNDQPPTAFRILQNDRSVDELIKLSQPSGFVEGCYLIDSFSELLVDLVNRGFIYIQDEASQMVASLICTPMDGRSLDVCAAPGGKTGLIAKRNPESIHFAGDIHRKRVDHLRMNCDRQVGDRVKISQYDAVRSLPFAGDSFDSVLVDAPCSGTGTIRHNPELRYSISDKDMIELPDKQLSILLNASNLVKSGGQLVYSTCSLEPEENETVCVKFLSLSDKYEKVQPDVSERFVTEDGFARTWPDKSGMDGFFVAVFRKK